MQNITYSVEEVHNILTWLNTTNFDQNLGAYKGTAFGCNYEKVAHKNWVQYRTVQHNKNKLQIVKEKQCS